RVGKSVLFATESVRHHSLTQTNESPEKSGRFTLLGSGFIPLLMIDISGTPDLYVDEWNANSS
ncbi:hypothetical protein SAMN05216334_1507, partial [Nitrosomonas ureae]